MTTCDGAASGPAARAARAGSGRIEAAPHVKQERSGEPNSPSRVLAHRFYDPKVRVRRSITERVVARPDLDYFGLFDASPNPYLVLDRNLNIVGANQAYLKVTKRELSDIVGRWAWDAFPTDSETLREAIASFQRVMRDRKPDTLALLRFDIPKPEAEGGGFETRYWSIVASPVLDAAGEVSVMLQHPIDVTELQRLRDAVHDTGHGRRSGVPALAQSGIFERAQAVHETNRSL